MDFKPLGFQRQRCDIDLATIELRLPKRLKPSQSWQTEALQRPGLHSSVSDGHADRTD
jgi:hypothetical protein